MSSFMCDLFGHKTLEGMGGGYEYMHVHVGPTDGIGRVHAVLTATCPRCGDKYKAGAIHIPKLKQLENM